MTPEQVYALCKGKKNQKFIGSMNALTPGQEQQELTSFDNNNPKDGDMISVLADNLVWMYSEEQGQWFVWKENQPIEDATNSKKGIVKIGDGINVQAGEISTSKNLIGLQKVENIRQYSDNNPAPEKVTFDGVEYVGDTQNGVYIDSNAVKYTPQNLTNEQKKIARQNIGVGDAVLQSDWNQTDNTQQDFIKNKPHIPEKQSDLINDDYTVKDPNYSDRVFANLTEKMHTISQVETNRLDIIDIKADNDLDEENLKKEITRATGSENKLQKEIEKLKGKTQLIGGTNCAVGQEQQTLTDYTKTKTGQTDRPRAGDTVNVIYDDTGNVRQEQWAYIQITGDDGQIVTEYWEMVSGPPLVTTATETDLGVVKVPADGGILVDIDGAITATKQSIGLGKVDNIRQYSSQNPPPVKIKVDDVEFNGNTKDGVDITTNAVLYDRVQHLSEAQKKTARDNIGIQSAAKPDWNAAENTESGILNKPNIPTKTSELVNDSNFIVDANYVHTDYNFTKAAKDNVASNTADVKNLKPRMTQVETDLATEKLTRSNADADLQTQIDQLKGTPTFVGSIATMATTDDLTNYVKGKTGKNPVKGHQVSVLDTNQIWMYNGDSWEIYLNSNIADATKTTKGVVQVGNGISVSNGVISADKISVGLDKLDNVRQYSDLNPAPIRIALDGNEYLGTTATGLDMTTDYVRYGSAQNLTEAQKLVARTNIGVDDSLMSKSDWNATPGQKGEILNKPIVPEKTSQLANDNNTVIDPNYEDRVFTNKAEKDNTLGRITDNENNIKDIQDEQIEQNEEIANLKKKSFWVGSIQKFSENADTDEKKNAELTKYVKDKLGVDPAEGNKFLNHFEMPRFKYSPAYTATCAY